MDWNLQRRRGGSNVCYAMLSKLTPSPMHWHQLSLPVVQKCYKVGTFSRCLSEWEKPIREVTDFSFHEVKIICTTHAKEKQEITFFYGKMATLEWDLDRGDGWKVTSPSILIPSLTWCQLLPGTQGLLGKPTSGKCALWGTTSFTSLRFGTWLVLAKRPPFGIKSSQSMSGGHALLRHVSPSNVVFLSSHH